MQFKNFTTDVKIEYYYKWALVLLYDNSSKKINNPILITVFPCDQALGDKVLTVDKVDKPCNSI